jgi:hypothetical protein
VEEAPRRIETEIDIKLLYPFVIFDHGPVASDDIADLADDREILHPLGEASDESELDLAIGGLHTAMKSLVHHLDGANESILALVGVPSVNDHSVEAYLVLAVRNCLLQLDVGHLVPLLIAGVVLIRYLVVYYHYN